MSDKYSVNVCWDDEDNCFIATCLEFPLLSAHGDTREEAISEFQLVLEMAIESFTEDHLELPKPKTTDSHSGQFRIRLPKSLHSSLAEMAEKENVSLNTYVISLLSANNASQKAYAEKTNDLERIVANLTSILVPQHDTLQVHTQKLNLLESTKFQQKTPTSEWSTMPNDILLHRIFTD